MRRGHEDSSLRAISERLYIPSQPSLPASLPPSLTHSLPPFLALARSLWCLPLVLPLAWHLRMWLAKREAVPFVQAQQLPAELRELSRLLRPKLRLRTTIWELYLLQQKDDQQSEQYCCLSTGRQNRTVLKRIRSIEWGRTGGQV